ncbi:hypothetical protein EGW08_007783 [Elysia chlorotica]|uniref:L-Fucosyltransferase n=1 Tax=Elysia chlorotica TaxID=188477 RepID=A0A433TSA3_ELYCH|nr:hypothetical protein EGW08_007783 [Elysia chlorotica]
MLKPPCNILDYVVPNLVNWSLPVSFHEVVGKENSKVINLVDNVHFWATVKTTNFTQLMEEKGSKYTYMKANLDYSKGLRDNKLYVRQLSWMANLSNDMILSTLYKRVFKLSERLEQKMINFMQQALPTSSHRLICAHVRMGTNPDIRDTSVRFHENNLSVVWKFLATHSKSDKDKVFLISDSENVWRMGRSQTFGHRMVASGGPVNHVDRSGSLGTEERCAGLEKVIFDQHVLMQCDVLLMSFSGVSRMAAYIRGTHEGLYCLTRKEDIVPCEPKNIPKLYRIMG